MRSPIVAMLWENWRLSRVEAAQRFGLGIVVGSAAMVLSDDGAGAAFFFLAAIHAFFWFSIAKLNGGRFMDGYKPGFPLYLLYTRPVPTTVFVFVAMAYDAFSCVALYIISAALLGHAFDQPLPMFSVALLFVTIHFVFICIQWSTRNRVVQWTGSFAVCLPFFFLLRNRLTAPVEFEFSLAENALMVLVCVVTFGLTVAGVARQRRGDSDERVPLTDTSGGYPVWIINLVRFPCPTSSATRAQLWFELKSSGLPVLTTGVGAGALIFMLFATGIPIELVRQAAIGVPVLSVALVLFQLGGNAFGIRKKQGRTYVSAFESTQPNSAAQLAGIKVLVRSVCMLMALSAIGVSVWISSALVGSWGEWVQEGSDASAKLLESRRKIGDAFGAVSGHTLAAGAFITAIATAVMVASLAVFTALRARYRRRVLIAVSLLMLYVFALVVLAWAVKNGVAPDFLLPVMLTATKWIAGAATLSTTIYLLWAGVAERALSIGYVCGALGISAALGAALFAVMPPTEVIGILWTALVVLMVIVLTPWAYSRILRI